MIIAYTACSIRFHHSPMGTNKVALTVKIRYWGSLSSIQSNDILIKKDKEFQQYLAVRNLVHNDVTEYESFNF